MELRAHTSAALVLFLGLLRSAPAAAQPDDPVPTDDVYKAAPGDESADDSVSAEEQEGETIVVTASRRETRLSDAVVATEVITEEEIRSSGATNAYEALSRHPGITVFRGLRGASVRMQGLDSQYVLVLIDGKRTIGRIGGELDLERYRAEDIESIEVVKGPASALYGSDAIAGVIHIRTKKPSDDLTAEIRSMVGSHREVDVSGRASAGVGAGIRPAVSLALHRGDGYDLTPATEDTTASAYREVSGGAQAALPGGDVLDELDLGVDLLRRDLDGIDTAATGAVMDRQSVTEEVRASASAVARDDDRPDRQLRITTQGNLFRDQLLIDQRGSDEMDLFEKTRESLLRTEIVASQVIGEHLLSAGVDTQGEYLRADRLSERGERYRVAVFAQDEWLLFGKRPLIASPGFRIDLDSQFGVYPSPKLALRWDLSPRAIARLGYGLGYRAPNFRELLLRFENPGVGYLVAGNPDLQPELSHGVNGGLEVRANKHLWLQANGYVNRISNLITIDLVDDGEVQRFRYENIESARTRGVEGLATIDPLRDVELQVGYTLTDTRDSSTGLRLPGRARHRATFAASYAPSWIRASVQGDVTGRRSFDREDEGMVTRRSSARMVTLDARLARDLVSSLTGFAGVRNLTSSGDAELVPQPPRTFYAGLETRY